MAVYSEMCLNPPPQGSSILTFIVSEEWAFGLVWYADTIPVVIGYLKE